MSPRLLVSLSFSWPFGVVRVPAALSSGASDFGVFPGPRARDKHFMAEFAALWTAALTIQVRSPRQSSISQVLMTPLHSPRDRTCIEAAWLDGGCSSAVKKRDESGLRVGCKACGVGDKLVEQLYSVELSSQDARRPPFVFSVDTAT